MPAIKPSSPFARANPPAASPLRGAHAIILDNSAATAKLLRSHLEDRGAASVEIATTEDEALDILGNAPRPVQLAMMDTLTGGAACVAVLRILVAHQARIHVTLHGRHAPEQYAVPENLLGAAAYIHLATASQAVAMAESVISAGLTVRRILDDRMVPTTLDGGAALSIYGAPPGAPFPISLRP